LLFFLNVEASLINCALSINELETIYPPTLNHTQIFDFIAIPSCCQTKILLM
jgi:hypothetical protein